MGRSDECRRMLDGLGQLLVDAQALASNCLSHKLCSAGDHRDHALSLYGGLIYNGQDNHNDNHIYSSHSCRQWRVHADNIREGGDLYNRPDRLSFRKHHLDINVHQDLHAMEPELHPR